MIPWFVSLFRLSSISKKTTCYSDSCQTTKAAHPSQLGWTLAAGRRRRPTTPSPPPSSPPHPLSSFPSPPPSPRPSSSRPASPAGLASPSSWPGRSAPLSADQCRQHLPRNPAPPPPPAQTQPAASSAQWSLEGFAGCPGWARTCSSRSWSKGWWPPTGSLAERLASSRNRSWARSWTAGRSRHCWLIGRTSRWTNGWTGWSRGWSSWWTGGWEPLQLFWQQGSSFRKVFPSTDLKRSTHLLFVWSDFHFLICTISLLSLSLSLHYCLCLCFVQTKFIWLECCRSMYWNRRKSKDSCFIWQCCLSSICRLTFISGLVSVPPGTWL